MASFWGLLEEKLAEYDTADSELVLDSELEDDISIVRSGKRKRRGTITAYSTAMKSQLNDAVQAILSYSIVRQPLEMCKTVWEEVLEPTQEVVSVVGCHWLQRGVDSISPWFLKKQSLLRRLNEAKTYAEFKEVGLELDHYLGNDRWKMGFESEDYDFELVRDRLDELYEVTIFWP